MPRLIDAEKLEEYKASGISELTEWQQGWNDAIDTIMGETPTVDAEPVRHGHWIGVGQTQFERIFFSQRVFKCSVCGNYLDFDGVNVGRGSANFCPNCGAKMDERIEDVETKHAVETISGWIRLEN